MTPKQIEQFNRMRYVLKKIATEYESVARLRRNSEKEWGLYFDEAIEYAYDNIQRDARNAVRGIKSA